MNEGTVGNWLSKYRVDHAAEEPPLTVSDRARLRVLDRECRKLRMRAEFLKKLPLRLPPNLTAPASQTASGAVTARQRKSSLESKRIIIKHRILVRERTTTSEQNDCTDTKVASV